MNGYKAFYNQKEIEIHAETSYSAQKEAIKIFNPPKSKQHMVHVCLCEIENKQVIHAAVN